MLYLSTKRSTRAYFSEDERFLVVDGIKSVVGNSSCAEFFAYRVRWQAVHVHLDVRADFLVRQKLTGNYLHIIQQNALPLQFTPRDIVDVYS